MNDEKNLVSKATDLPKKNTPKNTAKSNTLKAEKKPIQEASAIKTDALNDSEPKQKKPRPPIRMDRKKPSNSQNTSSPKKPLSNKNSKIIDGTPKLNDNKTDANQSATQIEKVNPNKTKFTKQTPIKTNKVKLVENTKTSTPLAPKSNPKHSQSKLDNIANKNTKKTNEDNSYMAKPAQKLKTNKEKINNNNSSSTMLDKPIIDNIYHNKLNHLEKENTQKKSNIPFKQYKSNENPTANVGKINAHKQTPIKHDKTPIKHDKIAIHKEQISTHKEQLSANKEQISTYKEQISTHKEHLSANKEQLSTHKEQLSANKEQLSTNKAKSPERHTQAKPRKPVNSGRNINHSNNAAIDTPNAIIEKNANGGNIPHKASTTPNDKNAIRQTYNSASKNKVTPAAKILPKITKTKQYQMLISIVPSEQVEVVILENNLISEYYLEMFNQKKTKGNIYKGIIHNIDTNLQAAFINYGTNKNGFLQIDEVHPEYYTSTHNITKGKKFPPMQKVLKIKQEVLVQVVKEPSGSKGAFLTTWLSLAGRFLVLTPGQEQIGVSRKVVDEDERIRLRNMINGIEPGEGLGVIIRTSSEGTSKTTLKNDLQYLKRLWKDIRKKGTNETAPALVYQELALAERAMRDYLNDDIFEVWIDDGSVADSLKETASLLFPRKKDLVKVHTDTKQSLWERFNIQQQLEQIYSREVILPSGGRLIFDQTEALMAIDINSGKISGKNNFETMALKTNIEAAECIAHQLKLRDIGGQIVVDFIEMRDKNHVRDVEKTMRHSMRNDRARHDIGRISSFGLLEMVRQRTASSAIAVSTEPCPVCLGTGIRRNIEWQALQIIQNISRNINKDKKSVYNLELPTELALYFLNHKRESIHALEKQYGVKIEIKLKL